MAHNDKGGQGPRLNVSLPLETHAKLKQRATMEQITLQEAVGRAVVQYLRTGSRPHTKETHTS